MVFVNAGKIVDTIYQLINPEEHFEGINIAIHNITPKDVKGAPTFDVFYQSIKDKINNQTMVAHNLAFDGYALRDNLERYQIQPSDNQLLCTCQLTKRLILGQPSYSIKSLCQHYGIVLSNHHNALDDAMACAELMLKLIEDHELVDYDSIFNKTRIRPGILSPDKYRSSLVSDNNGKGKVDLSEIEISEVADLENPF